MKILAIESSCDETAIAIIENGNKGLANIVATQIQKHRLFGGVVPEIASRMHAEKINFLIDKALEEAQMDLKSLDAIAVTYGPGLEGSLLIGVTAAKTLAKLLKKPLIPVNHLHGHIYASFLEERKPTFPFIALLISGGHTQLVLVKNHFEMEILGTTRDDAVGEAFDKVARFLDLGYPGGPVVESAATTGNEKAYHFPRALIKEKLDFSFSGLKTAVIQKILKEKKEHKQINTADVCASFQKCVIDILLTKSLRACETHQVHKLVLAGGVVANKAIRAAFTGMTEENNIELFIPEFKFCTDNAAMIGAAAFVHYQKFKFKKKNYMVKVNPNLSVLCN